MGKHVNKEKSKTKEKQSEKHASKTRWDVYGWVGSGRIKVLERNLALKDAKKAKEKWIKKSAKHEAFIAAHADRAIVKGLVKDVNEEGKSKTASKAKSARKAKSKAKSKSKSKK